MSEQKRKDRSEFERRSKQARKSQNSEKRRYEKPRIVKEENFTLYSLNCQYGPTCSTQAASQS